ncbi:MAG TPA: SRPBCC family protein [Planococcus sp. (in: firmicutes)]|nr:SRPBCC family protein [Planococcus sp. (in: firmicutes)]
MAFKESVYIDATIETVFDITTDFEHAPLIMETVIRTEKLTDGPMQAGTEVKEVRNVRGREIETVLVVSEYVPHQKYSVKSDSAGMTVVYRYEFTAKDGGTTIDFTGSIQSKGLKNALIRPMFERILKKEDKDHLVKLKEYIEQQKAV